MNMNTFSEEICLIDSGIDSLKNVPLNKNLKVLNLHSNQIKTIECLESLQYLQHLDLSSNQISKINGLHSLVSLRTLNLACNLIEVVHGLHNLRNLGKLNLSYNLIVDIGGLKDLNGPQFKLNQLDLHGNKLQSVLHVNQCLQGCSNLTTLSLSQGGADNPLCRQQGYREEILSTLPKLDILDGKNRRGQQVSVENALIDIPGLEQFMEYLVSTDNNTSDNTISTNPLEVATPNIDAALETFRQREATTPEMLSSATLTSENDITSHVKSPHSMSEQFKTHQLNHDTRLEKLENQLAQLLHTKGHKKIEPSVTSNKKAHEAKRDIDYTDESDSDNTPTSRAQNKGLSGKNAMRNTKKNSQSTAASRKKCSSNKKVTDESVLIRSAGTSKSPTRSNHTELPSFTSRRNVFTDRDEKLRQDMKDTYVHLMKELETERERRWKAEQATKKLVDHVRELQTKGKEEHEMQEVTLLATTRLKDALKSERENKVKQQAQIELLQEEVSKCKENLDHSSKQSEDLHLALKSLQETTLKREQEYLQQSAHEAKKLQDAHMRGSASQRELEIVRNQVKSLKAQVQQLQELLASREQDHRKELASRYTLESKELQDLLDREISRAQKLHEQELKLQQEKIDSLSRQYNELENEFRLALQIESKRFTELQEIYQDLSTSAAKDKQELTALQQRGDTNSSMVAELTALVKEQKGRLTELAKAKQEQSSEYRDRVSTLEQHLEEARKRMLQLEMLKQEKVKLSSQLQAQESVIEGLKAERKLWGEELAQQGVSLAQDRGRMEAKIESLHSEVATLKKQLEKEADIVKIKSKMIDDQTESIRKLKQGIVERDEEVRKVREEMLKVQKDGEEQILAELTANQDFQEKLDRARERKDELKHQLSQTEEKLEQSEASYRELSGKWKQKTGVISELEHQVSQMRSVWENKEKKLTEERDKAVEAAKIAVDKIHTMDDAFRQQLDSKEQRHSEIVRKLHAEKQNEIDRANNRVLQVEEEMRELLKETETVKKGTEAKVKKLTCMLSELQQGLI